MVSSLHQWSNVESAPYRNQSLNMVSTFAFFFIFPVCIRLALALAGQQRRMWGPDPLTGFTLTPSLNLPDPLNATGKVQNPDGTYNVTTGYISYSMCSNTQISLLKEAVEDAVSLAASALDQHELKRASNIGVPFSSRAAIDYFGPPALNQPYQSSIECAHLPTRTRVHMIC